MTNPSVSQQPTELTETGNRVGAMPTYRLQLYDVVLGQLNVMRNDGPVDMPEDPGPDITWDVEFGELAEGNGVAAKLTLDYKFPDVAQPAYALRVELIGLFIGQLAGSALTEEAESAGSQAPTNVAPSDPEQPLTEYNVVVMLWPYLREIIQQLQLRMRVPVYLLPTLDVISMQSIQPPSE